jgi:hypothetical protein
MSGVRSRTAVAASVVVIGVAVVLGFVAGASAPASGRGPLAAAVATLPSSTTVAGFTDWQHIVDHYGLDAAMDRDLVTRSVLVDDYEGLSKTLGVRLGDVSWEIFGQAPDGDEATVLKLKRAMPSAARLRKHGYRLNAGVWSATGRLAGSEPIYAAVARLPRAGVMVIGTRRHGVAMARAVIGGSQTSFVKDRAVTGVVQALSGTQTAFIQTQRIGCEATKVGVEPERAREAAAAEARFGRLVPYEVLGRGLADDDKSDVQRFVVAMSFPSAAVASEQARTRAALSHGPFLGRTGNMSDVLRLRDHRSDGPVAFLTYDHPADSEYLMTGHGPLMPASC